MPSPRASWWGRPIGFCSPGRAGWRRRSGSISRSPRTWTARGGAMATRRCAWAPPGPARCRVRDPDWLGLRGTRQRRERGAGGLGGVAGELHWVARLLRLTPEGQRQDAHSRVLGAEAARRAVVATRLHTVFEYD